MTISTLLHHCGGEAFHYVGPVVAGEALDRANILHTNTGRMLPRLACCCCGADLVDGDFHVDNFVREVTH